MTQKPLAYEAYQQLADAYAAKIDIKPHNAYYDRPAMLSLLPDIRGQKVLDAGCGPGAYAEQLVARGATVVACDISPRMLELAHERLKGAVDLGAVDLQQVDLTLPLSMFHAQEFDLVIAPLCLDYIKDWGALFVEFSRILKIGGLLVFSCGHPAFDAEYFETENYFCVEAVECTWTGFGKRVRMPSYRRSLEEVMMPVANSGLVLEKVHEPRPTAEFKSADPVNYRRLMHRPGFICVVARKPDL